MGHLMTYREVASLYRVTPRTVRTWAAKGAITVTRTPSGRPRALVIEEESGSSGQNPIVSVPVVRDTAE